MPFDPLRSPNFQPYLRETSVEANMIKSDLTDPKLDENGRDKIKLGLSGSNQTNSSNLIKLKVEKKKREEVSDEEREKKKDKSEKVYNIENEVENKIREKDKERKTVVKEERTSGGKEKDDTEKEEKDDKERKTEKKTEMMQARWFSMLKENRNLVLKETPEKKVTRKRGRKKEVEKGRREGEQDIKNFLIEPVKRKYSIDKEEESEATETPSKRKKKDIEKEEVDKKKERVFSERKRKRMNRENLGPSDSTYKVGNVLKLRMQFEVMKNEKDRVKEKEKEVEVREEETREKAANLFNIGKSSLVDRISNRGRDSASFLGLFENGPIGRQDLRGFANKNQLGLSSFEYKLERKKNIDFGVSDKKI